MNCRHCNDTGRVEEPGAFGATVGQGERLCTCEAGDAIRAQNLVLELHYTPEVSLCGNGTKAAEVILKCLRAVRESEQQAT